jgi:outer membrane protein assembly factor BamB
VRRLLKVLGTVTASAMLAGVSVVSANAAGPALMLGTKSGSPTTTIAVKGSGFLAYEAVDVYFDSTDLALASADGTGAFSVHLTIPSTAQPGSHYVTAVGRADELSATVGFTVRSDWPQFHYGPTLTGLNPYENTLTPSNVYGLDEAWSFSTGGDVESSPAVVNGVLYVGSDDGNVYALNAATGALKWSVATGAPVQSSPAVAKSIVYVGSSNGDVYALKASTGASVWTDDLSFLEPAGFRTPPTVSGGVVYIQGESGTVYALDAGIGFDIWAAPPASCGEESAAAVAFRKGTVYATGFCGGEALSASNGESLRSFSGTSAPTVGQNMVFSGAGGMYWGQAELTSATRWNADYFGDDGDFTATALAGGVLYTGDTDRTLYALTAASGTADWSFTTHGGIVSSPAVADGVVYVGSEDDNVYALDASSGALLWTGTTGEAVVSSPVVVNGEVYVGSDDGNVYAFGLDTSGTRVARPDPSKLHPNMSLKRTI